MSHPEDLVTIAFHPGFTDGLNGITFTNGVSLPVVRWRAEQMCIRLGPPARIVEPSPTPAVDVSPSAPSDAPSDPSPASVSIPLDAPEVAPVVEALADELTSAADDARGVADALDATAAAVAPKRTRKPKAPKTPKEPAT